jgi:hypothetical protein
MFFSNPQRLQSSTKRHALRARRGLLACALSTMALVCGLFPPSARAMQLQVAASFQERESAARDLAAARAEVVAAQQECQRTRHALDDFLAHHLDAQREAAALQSQEDAQHAQQAKHREQAQSQLAELEARRVTLLQTLTDEHPEVIEVTAQIEALETRLKTADDSKSLGQDNLPENSSAALDATQYQQLLSDWRTAERRLESARLAETAAADRLHTLTDMLLHSAPASPAPSSPAPLAEAGIEPQQPAEASRHAQQHDAQMAAPAVDPGSDQSEKASRTQTLALAALALAVMLAALAAVRLARATADPLFASADEASAALAIPVVGIVPFGAKSTSATASTARRSLLMVAQVLIALVVFGTIAYVVVHLDVVVSDPVGTLRSWFGL